jgi:hypothetical protein
MSYGRGVRCVVGRIGFVVLVTLALGAVACGGNSASDEDEDDDNDGGSGGRGGSSGSSGSAGSAGSAGSSGSAGDTGIPRTKYLDELTPAEQQRVCEWAIAEQGGPGETDCGGGTTVNVSSVAECAAEDLTPFHCLYGLLEDCVTSLNGDPCGITTNAACEAYIACALGSQQ